MIANIEQVMSVALQHHRLKNKHHTNVMLNCDVAAVCCVLIGPVCASGGTLQGLISDCMGQRAPVLAASLLLAIGALVGYSREYLILT